MNRPRNRQPRRGQSANPVTPRPAATVPSSTQVLPGTRVSIILKADQPTGRETSGVVQDVLTSGDHPRGIKVRLRDGRVGRVQRVDPSPSPATTAAPAASTTSTGSGNPDSGRFSSRFSDARLEPDYFIDGEPPPRSLADYIPDQQDAPLTSASVSRVTVVNCPFCDGFEGDETAVTHHIDRQHLGAEG